MIDSNMFRGIKALIFDMDGTLVDSMWMWRQIDIEFLQLIEREYPEKLQQEIEGKSFTETAVYFKERFNIDWPLEKIMDCWNEMAYKKYRYEVKEKKGALEFIKAAKAKGYKLAIASSNSLELIRAAGDNLGFNDIFDSVVNCCEVKKGKPAPDVYLEAARRLGAAPSECMVFEDIAPGIMAGKNAGMKVCAVEDDYSLQDKKEKLSISDYYIEDYESVLSYLEDIK